VNTVFLSVVVTIVAGDCPGDVGMDCGLVGVAADERGVDAAVVFQPHQCVALCVDGAVELYEQLVAEAAAQLGMPAEFDVTDLAAAEELPSFGAKQACWAGCTNS
jgi:hypothetical protein